MIKSISNFMIDRFVGGYILAARIVSATTSLVGAVLVLWTISAFFSSLLAFEILWSVGMMVLLAVSLIITAVGASVFWLIGKTLNKIQ